MIKVALLALATLAASFLVTVVFAQTTTPTVSPSPAVTSGATVTPTPTTSVPSGAPSTGLGGR
ncbi:MAG: hypothetical protein M1426_02615 [Patescibacteria group bacterium]|nr:hypothetical protein [Patescibacteria group bacterium]